MSKRFLFTIIVLISFSYANAQYYRSSQVAGIMAGPLFFQGDYGERGDTENFIKNNGFSVGGIYYLSFVENYRNLRENFKIRVEASFTKSDFEHYGQYVAPEKTSLFAQQLRAMSGSTQIINVGFQVECYPWKLDDYTNQNFSPYISVGTHFGSYETKVSSSLGPLGTPITTPDKYIDGFKNGSGIAISVTGSIGTRYRLSSNNALIVEARWQRFFSDWVDGLNPNKEIYTENKSNDFLFGVNFGYIIYFK